MIFLQNEYERGTSLAGTMDALINHFEIQSLGHQALEQVGRCVRPLLGAPTNPTSDLGVDGKGMR
jgi:hypothetical protein